MGVGVGCGGGVKSFQAPCSEGWRLWPWLSAWLNSCSLTWRILMGRCGIGELAKLIQHKSSCFIRYFLVLKSFQAPCSEGWRLWPWLSACPISQLNSCSLTWRILIAESEMWHCSQYCVCLNSLCHQTDLKTLQKHNFLQPGFNSF